MKNRKKDINLKTLSPGLTANYLSKGKFQYPLHIAYIDSILMQTAAGNITRLIVNLPPRHGKSELISKYFPFWYLCHFPNKRVILSSYEATFAQFWGKKVRELIQEYGMQYFGIKLSKSSQSAGFFEIEAHDGSMTCVGAGGPITGKGADLFIIDDPIKNDEEANSPNLREKLKDWFKSTVYTRLEPNSSLILMMTRWHEDDLCGFLQSAKIANDWTKLVIPAIAESGDCLGRKQGEALWSKRFPLSKLHLIRKTIGSYWFDSLYQQRPIDIGGGIFKRANFRYFYESDGNFCIKSGTEIKLIPKKECMIFSAVDLAISTSENADYTVVATIASTTSNDVFVIDIIRKRINPSEHSELLRSVYERFKPYLIGVENVQYQCALIQEVARIGLPVKELKPDTDKFTRALPLAAKIEIGKIFFKSDAIWLSELEDELLKFPKCKHDDQTDALAYAVSLIPYVSKVNLVGKRKNSFDWKSR